MVYAGDHAPVVPGLHVPPCPTLREDGVARFSRPAWLSGSSGMNGHVQPDFQPGLVYRCQIVVGPALAGAPRQSEVGMFSCSDASRAKEACVQVPSESCGASVAVANLSVHLRHLLPAPWSGVLVIFFILGGVL